MSGQNSNIVSPNNAVLASQRLAFRQLQQTQKTYTGVCRLTVVELSYAVLVTAILVKHMHRYS